MRDTKIIESKKTLAVIDDDFIPRELYPKVFNFSELITDHSLPLIKLLNIEDSISIKKKILDIKLQVPVTEFLIDLFLFVNNKKQDMFYQIPFGEYSFRNIMLTPGKNLIEIFYKHKSIKSTSVFLNIINESKV